MCDNRYMRNDTVPIPGCRRMTPSPGPKPPSGPGASPKAKPSRLAAHTCTAPLIRSEIFLNRFLERLHLGDSLDSGDLLVLLLLFMLFRENADEELLIALGLLLIL